jgi:hypothetical protein
MAMAALLVLLACDNTAENYTPEPDVFCLLRTDSDTARVLVGMTVGYYDSIAEPDKWNGVAGAAVLVEHRGTQLSFAGLGDSVGYYANDSARALPGDTYLLSVKCPAGQTVSGTTIVPDSFGFDSLHVDTTRTEYEPGEVFIQIGIHVKWNVSNGAGGYLTQYDAWYKNGADSTLLRIGPYVNISPAREDSALVPPVWYKWDGGPGDSLPLDRVRVLTWAADGNYYDYCRLMWEMTPAGHEQTHLNGGVGVFGSACIAETTLRSTPSR